MCVCALCVCALFVCALPVCVCALFVCFVCVYVSYRELVLDLELLAGRAHQVLHQILHTHITQIVSTCHHRVALIGYYSQT
jgi:CBS domain containing-hemolysin-like protein